MATAASSTTSSTWPTWPGRTCWPCRRTTSGHCYNVGRGVGTTIKELTELLLRLAGSRLPIQYEPAGLTFVTNRIGCPLRAERDLGYRWTIDLEEGMRSLIAMAAGGQRGQARGVKNGGVKCGSRKCGSRES